MKAEEEMKVLDQPTYIEPSFDLRALRKELDDPEVPEARKLSGLLGLHIKIWHAPATELQKMLYRAGHGRDVIELIPKMVKI